MEPEKPDEEPSELRSLIEDAVRLAADNPNAFTEEVTRAAKKLGAKAEDAYQVWKQTDGAARQKAVRNGVVQGIARMLKRELKL